MEIHKYINVKDDHDDYYCSILKYKTPSFGVKASQNADASD